MRATEFIVEYRNRLLQYVKSLLPTWPEYVLKDWLVPNKGSFSNLPDTELKNGIMEKLKGAGLTPNSKWQLIPDMKFTMDMFEPKTKQRLIGRAGGSSDLGMGIPKDKERHATQAALAQQQGGVRKEPVLLIKTVNGYELLEGWHRTIQHFHKFPDGYTGPAYVAVAQGQQGVAEGLEHADKLSGLVDLPVFTSSTNTSGTAKVVNTGDRIMAVLNIRGVNIPYYISTGGGGKASVPTGKWYPIFGRHSSGWLNKGGEDSINKSYGSNALALGSSRLNNMLGDLSSMESQIPFMKKSGDGIINRDLHPMSYAEVSANPDEFKKRVNSLLAKLGSPPFYKVKATETQGVTEGATVTRIDSKPITDFGSSLKAYKHTDDWSQSGVDTGDDSYWKNKNLKTNTTKGLFAGDPKRTALYATGNAHETRYVEFTQNGQPIVYFDRKDLPAMRSRKTYLTVFDASDFRQLPTGEWFSENPSKPIKQVPIGDPFKYIADQGWIVRVTDDLDKVFKQVKNMHKAGKIAQYGAEGMNESKQGVAEGLAEAVGGNYLYHATSASGLKGMLSSGSIRSATGPQAATSAQTKLPTVSVTRDWGYASGGNAQTQMVSIGRDAILVLDRNAVESNFKTLGTSQSTIVKGLSFNPYFKRDGEARSQNTDPMARANAKAKMKYAEPTAKAGGEFEEAVVVPKGALPLKGTMVGFWINPKSELMKDPTIMNDPRRLDMVRPNQFVKAKQEQGVAEGVSNSMSTDDMIAYLRQHHDTNLHQDYLNHVNTFSKFVLKDIPTNTLKTDLPGLDREKVERYKKMDQSKAPPIVLGGKYILDGYHRANAIKELGIPTIKAYVGITTK